MGWLSVNNASTTSLAWGNSFFTCGKCIGLYDVQKCLPANSRNGVACSPRALGSRNSVKKLRRERLASERVSDKTTAGSEYAQNDNEVKLSDDSAGEKEINVPSRGAVLQACTVTSGLLAGLGILIRQASHIASIEGLPVLDCSLEVSFDFEMWHLQLIAGLVFLISSSRYILLKTWPEFAESSNTTNEQVEYSKKKYVRICWASLVGFVYGYATIASSSLVVPMVSHAMNNLVGGILWRYRSHSSGEISNPN